MTRDDRVIENWRREDCARDIKDTINTSYNGYSLKNLTFDKLTENYGYDRIGQVLAATVCNKMTDGRIARDVKDWASQTYSPSEFEENQGVCYS
jgi:hypothetical protein